MKHLHRATNDAKWTVNRECDPNSKYICDMCKQQMCFECADVNDDGIWMHHLPCLENDTVTVDEALGIPLELVNKN